MNHAKTRTGKKVHRIRTSDYTGIRSTDCGMFDSDYDFIATDEDLTCSRCI